MGIENHELHGEFPQYSDLIDQLAEADTHFRQLLNEYASLDREIMRLEKRLTFAPDESEALSILEGK